MSTAGQSVYYTREFGFAAPSQEANLFDTDIQTLSDGNSIQLGTGARQAIEISGVPAAVTASASLPIQNGTFDGQEVLLIGTSDAASVSIISGGNCNMNGNITLSNSSTLHLIWRDSLSKWVEIARN